MLDSPLDVTEFHTYSDALAPDHGKRVPMSAGTSVGYNYVDFRFKNNTDQDFQLLIWFDEERMYGELRCEKEIPWVYEIVEEDHHFEKEGEDYYRVSKIYRDVKDKSTGGARSSRPYMGQSVEGGVRPVRDTLRSNKGVVFAP